MAEELKLPELGENIESGQIVRVLVGVGERINIEQPIVEIETGKATIEVPATSAGKITAINVSVGDTVKVGQTMLTLEPESMPLPADAAPIAESAEPPPPPPPAAQPQAPSAPAPVAAAPAPAPAAPPAAPAAAPAAALAPTGGLVMAAPHVRQFAREVGVDVNQVPGSGPGGRVSVEDVKRYAREIRAAGPTGAAPAGGPAAPMPLPDFAPFGPTEREPMSGVRQRIAEQMSLCWNTIPHVVLQAKADITELEEFRVRYKGRAEAAGGKLTLTAILMKVAAAALKAFPKVNASVDMNRRELVLKKYIHLGVATDTPRGLLVPVVRDVDRKSLVQISVELNELSAKARAGKLLPSDMQGASFSVTNLGGMGIGFFSAVINHPEVAILAVGKAVTEPVWVEDEFRPRLMLPLALNIDHRVLDGADGARFLGWIVQAIEQPFLLALEG